jgi:hypothetical protein
VTLRVGSTKLPTAVQIECDFSIRQDASAGCVDQTALQPGDRDGKQSIFNPVNTDLL